MTAMTAKLRRTPRVLKITNVGPSGCLIRSGQRAARPDYLSETTTNRPRAASGFPVGLFFCNQLDLLSNRSTDLIFKNKEFITDKIP